MAKQEDEIRQLQAAMHAAILDASKDAQSKDKRILHLEKKVISFPTVKIFMC
jgi:predicted RecB family nuclease